MRTRTGKIARLPLALREELNRRMLENEPASKILPWLNGLPQMQQIIGEMGEAGGHKVGVCDDKNLSDWRRGGFAEWVARRERVAETRELASWSVKLAQAAGGNISEGAAAILSGQLLEILEGLAKLRGESAEDDAERMQSLAKAVDSVSKALASVRTGDHNRVKLDLEKARLGQNAEALGLEKAKFQRSTCELFLQWAANEEAKAIAAGGESNSEKISRLGQLMFGEEWDSKA